MLSLLEGKSQRPESSSWLNPQDMSKEVPRPRARAGLGLTLKDRHGGDCPRAAREGQRGGGSPDCWAEVEGPGIG